MRWVTADSEIVIKCLSPLFWKLFQRLHCRGAAFRVVCVGLPTGYAGLISTALAVLAGPGASSPQNENVPVMPPIPSPPVPASAVVARIRRVLSEAQRVRYRRVAPGAVVRPRSARAHGALRFR